MNEIKKRVYELLFSPLVTPKSLIDNITLDCYKEITYKKKSGRLICDMTCIMDDNSLVCFSYYFYNENFLMFVYKQHQSGEKELVFDRASELEKIKMNSFPSRIKNIS